MGGCDREREGGPRKEVHMSFAFRSTLFSLPFGEKIVIAFDLLSCPSLFNAFPELPGVVLVDLRSRDRDTLDTQLAAASTCGAAWRGRMRRSSIISTTVKALIDYL